MAAITIHESATDMKMCSHIAVELTAAAHFSRYGIALQNWMMVGACCMHLDLIIYHPLH